MLHNRLFLIRCLFLVIFASLFFLVAPGNIAATEMQREEFWERARVIEVIEISRTEHNGFHIIEQEARVEVLSGAYKGQILTAQNTLANETWDINISPGDKIIVYLGLEHGHLSDVYVADHMRSSAIHYILIVFVLLLILVGGIKGIKAIIALALTIFSIYFFLLPLLIKGYSPILITILILVVVTIITMLIIGGFSRKALVATIGTMGGVIIAGLLAYYIGNLASLTGFASEESRMLLYVDNIDVDIKGILFAGIIIGALGATMDVAMSIASAIEEIRKAHSKINSLELIKSGMNVGRDIMGTMVNTLILAYAGGALPMLLLFMAYDTSWIKLVNAEFIATEIIRAIAGSIGLILSVPITALVAGLVYTEKGQEDYRSK